MYRREPRKFSDRMFAKSFDPQFLAKFLQFAKLTKCFGTCIVNWFGNNSKEGQSSASTFTALDGRVGKYRSLLQCLRSKLLSLVSCVRLCGSSATVLPARFNISSEYKWPISWIAPPDILLKLMSNSVNEVKPNIGGMYNSLKFRGDIRAKGLKYDSHEEDCFVALLASLSTFKHFKESKFCGRTTRLEQPERSKNSSDCRLHMLSGRTLSCLQSSRFNMMSFARLPMDLSTFCNCKQPWSMIFLRWGVLVKSRVLNRFLEWLRSIVFKCVK